MFFLAALATLALASCTSDEFIGETSQNTLQKTEGAILFAGGAGNITRATSNTGTVAEMLDGQMKIYGVKKASTTYATVFEDYQLWDATDKTTSNPDGDWEYVGAAGTYGTVTLTSDQNIKYWDYATDEYHFVAGSPVGSFDYHITGGEITSATVTGLAGHLEANPTSGSGTALTTNPVYIAAPVYVPKANYKQDVTFNFTRQQAFVRVGVYETIPGYKITSIHFYEQQASDWKSTAETSQNIILASKTADYFSGATNGTATVTYSWSSTPTSTFAYTTSTLTQSKNWYGGELNGVPAISSAESTIANLYGTDKDMAATGYFTVIPMASGASAQPILIKCDYTLEALDGTTKETINVTGATATIPADYTKWAPNTSYTYLFKISDNTNGSTGTPGTDPEGLFPITFDAAVVGITDYMKGTETTVSTPSITVYQDGDVVANGITFKAGDVEIKAMVGNAEVNPTWYYYLLANQNYDYSKDYEKLGAAGAATSWTSGKPTSVTAGTPANNYVLKAVYNDGSKDITAYFVLVVGAAENGPAN